MQTKGRFYLSVLAICALVALPAVAHAAPPSPFTGHWQGVDVDGSDIRLTIAGPPNGPFRITWTESYITFCGGGPGIVTGTAWLNEGDANLLDAELHVRCFTTGASGDFSALFEYRPDTNTLKITYEDGRFVICYRPGRGRVQSDARIVASAEGDWLWTSDFAPWDTLTISIYESDHPRADLRWTGTKTADQGGFVHVLPEDTGALDFELGNYVTVSDSFIEKGLVLESITMHTFDLNNEIMAGTAPAGREVTAVAGMAAAETQASMTVVADGNGDWLADFTTIPFDITEAMRPWSFAWIFDEDGDANEANPPPAPRSLRTPNYYVVWSETNPEEVTCLSWRGSDNLVSVYAHPEYCTDEDLEFFGNSWASENEGAPGFFFQSLVGWGTTGTWAEAGLEVAIASECTGCGGPSGIPIATTYQFFEEEWKADLIKVQREIDFGTTPYKHDVRPFIPRLHPADGFTEVLYPVVSGSALMTTTISACDYGCKVTDWNGTWFAMHNPETGLGMIVQHETSADPVALWVDNDAGSFTNASAVLLLQPTDGFAGMVTETEYLCFYHSGIWTPSLTLPSGCQP
jgi:hypothetical protein